jgi:hypothetical protein
MEIVTSCPLLNAQLLGADTARYIFIVSILVQKNINKTLWFGLNESIIIALTFVDGICIKYPSTPVTPELHSINNLLELEFS